MFFKKKVVTAPQPAAPVVALPEVDGGGDCVIYLERHDGLIPHLAASPKRQRVCLGGVEYAHVSEHEGCWVYRAA